MSDNKNGKEAGGLDAASSSDRERDVYLSQIRYLTERLERYELKCDELQRQKKDLEAQYNTLETDKKDIVEFLKRSLLEKEGELEAVTDLLQAQGRAADEERDAEQLRHSQLTGDLQGRVEELTAKNGRLEMKLASLEEFQQQKEQLTSRIGTLETQLTREEQEHRTDVHDLEMKALLNNKRLEEELARCKAAVAEQVRKQVAQKLSEMTRADQGENVELKAQLSKVSELAKELTEENATLRGYKSRLGSDVELLEKMLSEVSLQSCVHKKVAKQLTEKCQQLQEEQKTRPDLQRIQAQHKDAVAEMEALRQRQASLSDQHSKSRAEVRRLQAELLKEKEKSRWMKGIMQDASHPPRQAPMEATTELESVVMLDLNRASQKEEPREKKPEPAAARTPHLDPASNLQSQLARCGVGDLDPVHPPPQKHTDTPPRPAAAPLHRKPSSQKNHAAAGPSRPK